MKQRIFTLLFFAGAIYAKADAQPTIKAQRTIGGSLTDNLTSINITKDGGLIAGGYSYSNISGEKTENSRGGYDYWVVKFDSLGSIQWDKTIGGSNLDWLTSLTQTSDGGYILGGLSYSNISGEKTENSRGDDDYWIVKLDSSGNIQWDKTIGGSDLDGLNSLQQTSDGGYILGGGSRSNISGEKTENRRGGYEFDYWIVKLDNLGNIQWDKTIGGNSGDNLQSIQQTADNGYILGGNSSSGISGEKTENNRGSNYTDDYWIIKLDSLRNIQWDKTIGGSANDYYSFAQQTSDGGYILGGSSTSDISGEKTQRNRGGNGAFDYWAVKIDSTGNIQWDKTIGGYRNDNLYALQQTGDDGYILGGASYSNISREKTENNRDVTLNTADYWVVKLNGSGKIQWDKTIGGSDNDYLINIKEIGKDRYVAGGYSYSGISGDKTQSSRGVTDYWLVSLFNKTIGPGINSTSQEASDITAQNINNGKAFTVYPNPAKDVLHIQTNASATFSLTDQSGKIICTKTITDKGEIDVTNFPPGLYYLKNNATGATQKVVIMK
jgi:hypothetical protein